MKCKNQIVSLLFLDSFIGFSFRNVSTTKLFPPHTGLFRKILPSISDLLHRHISSRLCRSASRSLVDVPRPRDSKTKKYGHRAFGYVGPSLWNVLPESIKKESLQSFRASLTTHFYLGRIVSAIVREVGSCWCVCGMVYIAVNTDLFKALYISTVNYYVSLHLQGDGEIGWGAVVYFIGMNVVGSFSSCEQACMHRAHLAL